MASRSRSIRSTYVLPRSLECIQVKLLILMAFCSETLLPPISGRDIIAVGKNYTDHAAEVASSSASSAPKGTEGPKYPVIFTKRATSIIAHEEPILAHEHFTQTLDYEGELAVIIGRGGTCISEADALDYVWGYTIVNDVSAREKQFAHVQNYIGKSADSFCPMGPVAVRARDLTKALHGEAMRLTTFVNGEKRQDAQTGGLIFSIACLISTLSEAQTLRPGDVIATGTPAGVGMGRKPPEYLKPGDVVEISVTGIGTLRNRVVAGGGAQEHASKRLTQVSFSIRMHNVSSGVRLTTLSNGKRVNVTKLGSGPNTLIFVHGLGASSTFFDLLLHSGSSAWLDHYTILLHDLEGHGMSPTRADSIISIESYAADLHALLMHPELAIPREQITFVAHSMGCLIVAKLVLSYPTFYPSSTTKMVLLSPPPVPMPSSVADELLARAAFARQNGMKYIAPTVAAAETSTSSQEQDRIKYTAVLQSLLSQDVEGYAKGCTALAGATAVKLDDLPIRTLVVRGEADQISTRACTEHLGKTMRAVRVEEVPKAGHWLLYEEDNGECYGRINDFLHR